MFVLAQFLYYIQHIKNIMKPVVKESNEIIKVPVLWGNEERWKTFY